MTDGLDLVIHTLNGSVNRRGARKRASENSEDQLPDPASGSTVLPFQRTQHFGHEFSFEQIRGQIGKGGDQLLPVFLSKDEFESRGEEIQKYRGDLFLRKYMPKVKPFPCVRELFQSLIAREWKIALASSAKEEELKVYKKIANLSDLLDSEASSEDANQSKPHPGIFLAAAEHLEAVPQECIAVGDTPL